MLEFDLLTITRGHISAPAGYGKTQLIADSLKGHEDDKPVLILTHTNAGVAALRKRLAQNGISSQAYELQTLDGWALRLINAYPHRSGIEPQRLAITNPKQDYPAIQAAARDLIAGGCIDTILQGSYSRLWVDEYQDCSTVQHEMVVACANLLPIVVLGDPMQSVFGFAGRRVDWADLPSVFPEGKALETPWRWNNAGAPEIGSWLAQAREALWNCESIDLDEAPAGVEYAPVPSPKELVRKEREVIRRLQRHGTLLIIGRSSEEAKADEKRRHALARRNPGVTVVEAVELRQMMLFFKQLDLEMPLNAVFLCAELAAQTMTKVPHAKHFRDRIERIHKHGIGRFKVTEVDHAALNVLASPCYQSVSRLLAAIRNIDGARMFRPTIYDATQRALSRACSDNHPEALLAARSERDARRHQERTAGKIAIGTALLLKGLESDACLIMDAHTLDRHQLYVALTRGAKAIHIWSDTSKLNS
ncbi:UvrD-helicase domain-containing protein [Onishia niordana]|uniref:UvrD-helicase domain-containing protein n=1 Tax=Onishia niordana TaxID=2508711 RepID=UPI00144627EF|nr:UvrD-helicase domain-containing protein [Halomonas niordiana]